MIGLLTAGSQFLHPWYVVWSLPFLTVLWPSWREERDGVKCEVLSVEPERHQREARDAPSTSYALHSTLYAPRSTLHALRLSTWLAWLIFSGNIVLSYHFYIYETYYYPVFILEYLPLYMKQPADTTSRDQSRSESLL
jgi:hypothetical protein